MKSLRSSIAKSLISVNILIISMISLATVFGFFRMNSEWESGLTVDVTAALNNALAETYPDVDDIARLSHEELTDLSKSTLGDHKGRLNDLSFYSKNGNLLFVYDITDRFDSPPEIAFKPELIRTTARIRRSVFPPDASIGILTNAASQQTDRIQVRSFPLMGQKYTVSFDTTITTALLAGIFSSAIISLVISFFLSSKLSSNSRVFAAQLSKLADGERDINFSRGTTLEMQSSVTAAESLQTQMKHSEKAQLRKLQDIIHDLKTPVAALGIQFEAVSDGVLKIDKERISLLGAEFSRIEEIIAELSRYTKLSSEDYIPEPSDFDLNELAAELIERFEIQAEQNRQQLVFNRPGLPSMIETDKLGIMRVLNNLTVNALNNAPENSAIHFSIKTQRRIITNSDCFVIEIENDGRIDEMDLPLIFDRMYRSKQSGYQGSGLGLAISKTIIEKNGGKIIGFEYIKRNRLLQSGASCYRPYDQGRIHARVTRLRPFFFEK